MWMEVRARCSEQVTNQSFPSQESQVAEFGMIAISGEVHTEPTSPLTVLPWISQAATKHYQSTTVLHAT